MVNKTKMLKPPEEVRPFNQIAGFFLILAYQKPAMNKKLLMMLFSLVIGFTSSAQDISYDDLNSIDWNEYPFSLVELLLEKDFEFIDQSPVDEILETEGSARESFYQLTYAYLNEFDLLAAAYVLVDEVNTDNIPTPMPVLKLRFWHQNKNEYTILSDEIEAKCGEPSSGFYIGDNSSAFIIDKELLDGEPNYYINLYHLTKDEFDEMEALIDSLKQVILSE
jgi:hypothetical protein